MEDDDDFALRVDLPDPAVDPEVAAFLIDEAFPSVVTMTRLVVGQGFAPARVDFTRSAPRHVGLFAELFGCPVSFGAPRDRHVYSLAWARTVMPGRDPVVYTWLWAGDGGEGAKYWLGVRSEIETAVWAVRASWSAAGVSGSGQGGRCGMAQGGRPVMRGSSDPRLNSVRVKADGPLIGKDCSSSLPLPASPLCSSSSPALEGAGTSRWCGGVRNARPEFVSFLQFAAEICRVACSAGAIESINATLRRVVNARGRFRSEEAARNAFDRRARDTTPSRL